MEKVEVASFSGLTVEFAKSVGASFLVRGLRAVTDFEYELQLAEINQKLCPEVDTVFLSTDPKYSYLSSSVVKEVAGYHGNIADFVPKDVEKRIFDKLKSEE